MEYFLCGVLSMNRACDTFSELKVLIGVTVFADEKLLPTLCVVYEIVFANEKFVVG